MKNTPSRTRRRSGPLLGALSLALTFFLAFPPRYVLLAGDILRGGSPTAPGHGSAAGNPTAAAVQAGANNGGDTLARTTQALNAIQAMQAAARAAAHTGPNNLGADPNHPGQQLPNVPNGLGVGGLQAQNPSLWQGANSPTQTISGSGTNVTIVQTTQQALLNWETFNIGRDTHVLFDQTAGGANARQWIAFNKVNDPSGVPSQILGSLDALGQIYIINANGIIFGGSSQINVHTLVASALPINDNLISRGLLNNPDAQFLFSALPIAAGVNGTPAFIPAPSNIPGGGFGDVVVQDGAQITSPTSADHVGGRVALVGANVTNGGTISTPDGQTILAAGLQVGMVGHSSDDPSLRGLDVFVGAVDASSGIAKNTGLIEIPRADLTMAGKEVDQLGFVDSSTSVALNGRIDLLASYNSVSSGGIANVAPFLPQATGTVVFGEGSVTQIVPEYSSAERVIGAQLALRSQINVQGQTESLLSNAILFAPNAQATFNAGTWDFFIAGGTPTDLFIYSTGQINIASDALIDVSGSQDVQASVTENIIPVQLLGPELADSPLQRNGALRGQTISVDIRQTGIFNGRTWFGSPIGDLSGYVNLVQRTVGELTTAGGNITLNAGSGVNLQTGSTLDVSGGSINYAGGIVHTTQVLSGGHIFDISQATPDRVYDGMAGQFNDPHVKWGIVNTFQNPLPAPGHFEAGYVQGGNGGVVSITAPVMNLSGALHGNTVAGAEQRAAPPMASALALVFQTQDPNTRNFFEPNPPNIFFESDPSLAPAGAFVLSTEIVNSNGFGILKIDNSDGNITLPTGVSLEPGVGGSITLLGANIDIEGSVIAPSGTLNFTTYDSSPHNPTSQTPPVDPTRGHFVLGATGLLSTAGLLVDDRPMAGGPQTLPLITKGGSVSINGFDTQLAFGSLIDVSGGASISATGGINYGKGGAISVSGGQDPNIPSLLGGHLAIDGTLQGYSGGVGGTLNLLAPLVQVGGSSSNSDVLLLSPEFFSPGGFANFSVRGIGEAVAGQSNVYVPGVVIAPQTVIAPVGQSFLAAQDANHQYALNLTLLPQGLRAPVSLSFAAIGATDSFAGTLLVRGDLMMSAGSMIQTDPRGNVALSGDTVSVLGSIFAPGGNITIKGSANSLNLFPDQGTAVPTVEIGANAVLSAAGTTLPTPNSLGFRTGTVLDGGTISVSGNIVAEAGARLDVSGATDMLDLAPGYSGHAQGSHPSGPQLVPTRVDSNGGTISLNGGQELFTDATLIGNAGGSSANGGTLVVSSGRVNSTLPTDITLQVMQSGLTIPVPGAGSAIGHPVLDAMGQPITPFGYFAADSFNNSGFDSLVLKGTVDFAGAVNITAARSIIAGTAGIIYADSIVSLNAPYVDLGMAFQPPLPPGQQPSPFTAGSEPFYVPPVNGTGTLNVDAQLIDVGNLSLQNIGTANLVAANGDIRGDGGFDVAGDINLTAGQIYPPTETTFTIAAYDYISNGANHQGSVTINGSGTRQLPLSAGGTLNIFGSTITQNGTLRAPIGTINLGAGVIGLPPLDPITNQHYASTDQLALGPDSVTSVSAIDPLTGKGVTIPYGINFNGTAWVDPNGTDITAGGLPAKSVTIAAGSLSDLSGSSIDIRGGGDLFAYRFVPGLGGSTDILASSSSFAVIPGYQADYAPFAPYNPNPITGNLGGDAGYVNSNLAVGDKIYLQGSRGLPAGTYTLLPARYALLPGAFLVTPRTGTPLAISSVQADGSRIVTGYRFNDLNSARTGASLYSSFEIAPRSVVQTRAEYDGFLANNYFSAIAISRGIEPTRLPTDAGQLVLAATTNMIVRGTVLSETPEGGLGSLVDISSPVDILIAGSGVIGTPGTLVLDSESLSAFGADSLLIGGYRQTSPNGTSVVVTTNNLLVDNAGSPLTGPDVVLVANESLTLAAGSTIEATGNISNAGTLFVNEDGALVRVSSDPTAQLVRTGVTSSLIPSLNIDANVQVTGSTLILDSTATTVLDPTAVLGGKSVYLDSGQISLQLANVGNPSGLVLSQSALANLQSQTSALSLLSYSSIDIYGAGDVGALDATGQATLVSLALHAGEIRGFDLGNGSVNFFAQNILIDNRASATSPGVIAGPSGSINFNADIIQLGAGQTNFDQFTGVGLNASNGILFDHSGALNVGGSLTIATPLLTGATAAIESLSATGAVTINSADGTAKISGGLGSSLTISGSSIAQNSAIILPSGSLTLHATTGDVTIGGMLDVAGTAQTFFDLTKYTNGGRVNLISDGGSVAVNQSATINVSAQTGGGDAGTLSVGAGSGSFVVDGGTLDGRHGDNGLGGNFVLDVGNQPTLGNLDALLNAGSFDQSRSIRVRNGDVLIDGLATTRIFNVSADHGSINVTGTVDASGTTGGTINVAASGSVTLQSGALLTVAAQDFNHAGKGGVVSLAAGSEVNGTIDPTAMLDIQQGSTIDLSVAAAGPNSESLGNFTGKLHLRAPQTAGGTDVQIDSIDGTIAGASRIDVEGYTIFDASGDGSIDNQEANVLANGQLFGGNAVAMGNRLLANNAGLAGVFHVLPGAEIINRTGDLTLANNWDLSTYRFGPNADPNVVGSGEPGILTLRASGNLAFNFGASLSDGFDATTSAMWQARLLAPGLRSWSYNLVAGADFSAADSARVLPLNSFTANTGSVLIGAGSPALPTDPIASRSLIVPTFFQAIRTGTGDISIFAGRDMQLLNTLATVYTAGTQAVPMANFDVPNVTYANSLLGPAQAPLYPAQYSLGGGNVLISTQNDIAHYVMSDSGELVADSSKELPTSWLYRRGWIDPATGQFGVVRNGIVSSTSWWIDFSNFYEGVGALGGGDVTLIAGHNVSNVDALAPTNARMPKGAPNASSLLELGGGDVTVRAGNDIDGGVYYIERGQGVLAAGGSIHTNTTRAAAVAGVTSHSTDWLPTTLFVGKSQVDVSAYGDLLLGPVANPFLLPQGINNSFFNKTYFSTYSADAGVAASSLTGDVTLKDASSSGSGALLAWYQNIFLSFANPDSLAATSQPWLRLVETTVTPFQYAAELMAPSLRATAFTGDINVIGSLVLSPSAEGTVDLIASGAINGTQINLFSSNTGNSVWSSSVINLSDADPNSIPRIVSAQAFSAASAFSQLGVTAVSLVPGSLGALLNESGSTTGSHAVLQTKQALHAAGLLHLNDSQPVRLYARNGDISGTTVFAGKFAHVLAGRDITDVALYLQSNHPADVTVVSAGRDIVAYDPNSLLRLAAQASGNELAAFDPGISSPESGSPVAGDIQIGGPGTLEVLAGRNLDLGVGPNNPDGTAAGIVSIGNARNPYLPFEGASIIASAGVGGAASLSGNLDVTNFIAQFLDPSSAGDQATRYLPELGKLLGLTNSSDSDVWTAFSALTPDAQAPLALNIFYDVLRDAGRDHNNPASPNFGNYDNGYAAIRALFPDDQQFAGDISLTSREIKTANGGDISLLAPGGQLTVGLTIAGTLAADQGILTEHGGNISIFTDRNTNVGTSRIFTLRGGNEIIWSSNGSIAAGSASKTVQSAPPTRVLIDPQTADVETDLAGLATGGGIGVLESVSGVAPSDVDLIAPKGTIDAGDAGIRVSGNLNLAALQVINAGNIQVGGASSGVPAIAAPNIGGLTSAANTAAASGNAAQQVVAQNNAPPVQEETPSIISVEVLGYGGGDDEDEEQRRKKKQKQDNNGAARDQSENVAATKKKLPRNAAL